MTDDELDARFRRLAAVEPPAGLVARTLGGVEAARRAEADARDGVATTAGAPPSRRPAGSSSWRRWALPLAGAGAAMVGAAILLVPPPPFPADPSALVPRGVGEEASMSAWEVNAAVVRAGAPAERLRAGASYEAGAMLVFRVRIARPTTATLTRDGLPLWSGVLPAGAQELPVAYTLEPDERAATFTIASEGLPSVSFAVGAVRP